MTVPVTISIFEPLNARCHTYPDGPPLVQLFGGGLNYCIQPDPSLTPGEQHDRALQLLHAVGEYAEELGRIRDRAHANPSRPHPGPRPQRTEDHQEWTDVR